MVEPTGYTALDLIGFTDRGPYDPLANYVRNDLVHVGNSTWRCKIDDTTGITPTEGANWTIFIESATSLAGMSDVDLNTPKAGDGLVHDGNDWTNIPIMTQAQNVATGVHQFLYNRVKSAAAVGGLVITPNDDGSFSVAAGTATGTEQLLLNAGGTSSWGQVEQSALPVGEYYASCEGATSGIYLRVSVEPVTGAEQQEIYASDSSLDYEIICPLPRRIAAKIQVIAGTIIPTGGITLKPLIRLKSDNSRKIAPYAKTNRELTEDITDIFKSKGKIAYSSLNSPFNASSYSHGIDYKKVGNLLYITGHAELSSVTFNASTGYTIATLPAGFRPYIQHRVAPFFTNGYNADGDKGMQISIGSDGTIQLFGATSVTVSGALWFNAVLFTSAT